MKHINIVRCATTTPQGNRDVELSSRISAISASVTIQLIGMAETEEGAGAGKMINGWMEWMFRCFLHDEVKVSWEVLGVISRWTMCLGKQVGKSKDATVVFWAEGEEMYEELRRRRWYIHLDSNAR